MNPTHNEFICIKCGFVPWIEDGDPLICDECGGQLIDTGKSRSEWKKLYSQYHPNKKSNTIKGYDIDDFIRKIVVDPLGTFNQEIQNKVRNIPSQSYVEANEFVCIKCGTTTWIDEGESLICDECGGQLIDTGKPRSEWKKLYSQYHPNKNSNTIKGYDIDDFIRKIVVDPLGTFNQETQNKVRNIPSQSHIETNEFICIKCGDVPWIDEGDSLICEECGGQLIDSGKTRNEWKKLYSQCHPNKKSNTIKGYDIDDFIRKAVIDSLGTFNETLQHNIRSKRIRMRNETPRCPRCSSTNIETCGGYEYGSNGVGSSGYGWDTEGDLVITGYHKVCKSCGYTW